MSRPIGFFVAAFTEDGLFGMTALRTERVSNRRDQHQQAARNRNTVPVCQVTAPRATKEPTKGKVLYVGNLKRSTEIQQLAGEFAPFGTVTAIRLVVDKETGKPKGFGYVQYLEAADATKAMAQMDGKLVEGHKLKVTMAHQQNFMEF